LVLSVWPVKVGDNLATFNVRTGMLHIDPTASDEQQLAAIEDAVAYLRTGERGRWQRPRHLRLVPDQP
jgi:hypothetical protein